MRLMLLSSVLVLSLACNQPPQTAQQATTSEAQQGAQSAASPSAGGPGAPGNGEAPANGARAGEPARPAEPPKPAEPQKPMMMPMDVPAGTSLALTLENSVASDTSKLEDTVRAKVAEPVVVAGMTVIPKGATVTGTVVAAEPSGKVKGRALIAIRFNRVVVADEPYTINTARISREAAATKKQDAKKIAIGAGAGTAIGAIAGGGKGAAIGAAVGGAAGTGVVMATKGDEIGIPAGTTVKTTIDDTVRINAPM